MRALLFAAGPLRLGRDRRAGDDNLHPRFLQVPVTARKATLAPLTSLRFVAAAMVVCHHCFGFRLGYGGVTFFFVLSGFILTFNYAGRMATPFDRREFWRRRVARIYPTHLLTLIAALPFALHTIYRSGILPKAGVAPPAEFVGKELVTNLFLLQSWIPVKAVYFSLNSVSWSISAEAFFYALFPFLLVAFDQAGTRRTWRIMVAWGVALLGTALLWSAMFPTAGMNDTPSHYVFYINPAVRLYEFAFGVALGLAFLKTARRSSNLWEEIAALALTVVSFAMLAYLHVPIALALSILFIPAAVGLVFVFARGGGPISRLLSRRALLLLGEASFMLYMIHQLALRYMLNLFDSSTLVKAAAAAGAVLASIILHLWFEKPMQKLVLHGWRSRSVQAAAR